MYELKVIYFWFVTEIDYYIWLHCH